jgi:hypothetical protein
VKARSSLEHQIAEADRQIDRLVYDLYGLTEEEITIVEHGTAGGKATPEEKS